MATFGGAKSLFQPIAFEMAEALPAHIATQDIFTNSFDAFIITDVLHQMYIKPL